MTFAEIAAAMGEKRGTVFMVYKRALKKLQARAGALESLQSLAIELDRERNRHQIVEL